MAPSTAESASARVRVPAPVRALLERVSRTAGGQGVRAYAVGGCVRDWWLRRQVVDVDVCVEGDGIAVAEALGRELGVTVVSHAQFGTATVAMPAGAATVRLDVASCRKEAYAGPAAYPKVGRGTLRDDLFRRDFTINAMAMSLEPATFGALIDPFGGLRDLRTKRLRVLHANSFVDDPSRVLRAARFAPRFGLQPDPATRMAMRRAVREGLLGKLNRGRVRRELTRMLAEPDPVACAACLGRWVMPAARA